jgi:hypothetical protein
MSCLGYGWGNASCPAEGDQRGILCPQEGLPWVEQLEQPSAP